MNIITTSGIKRCAWRHVLSLLALCVLLCTHAAVAQQGVTLTITKSHDAPTPVPSGQVFTYTIAYSWTGGTGWSVGTPGTLIITDAVPSTLDVLSAVPGTPFSTISGNNVQFVLNNITAPAGAGTVQINVRFKPGVTCPNTRACNIAYIRTKDNDRTVQSNESCATATASNKWQFQKSYISGCIVDSGTIVYRLALINPSGNDIGGLNLNNISLTDFLPPGAIITGVTPFGVGSWNAASPVTGTSTLTGGPISATVQPGWGWWGCYISVRFPGGLFTSGQTVTNSARLTFTTPCTPQGQTETFNSSASNTLCNPTPPAPGGSIWKWLNTSVYFPANPYYYPSWSPGCCGTYYVQYYNNGGLTQSNIVLDDNLPSTVDVSSIYTNLPATMSSVAMDIYCYVGGTCQATPAVTMTYTSSSTYTPSGLPGPICRIRWRYTGNLPPGYSMYNSINVCVRSNSYISPFPAVVAGQSIVNTVCASGTNVPAGLCANSASTVTPTAPNILAAKFFAGKSGTCLPSCSPNTAGPFYPGDIVRWRMVVANVGSATATSCNINDVLPTGFTYVGNPTYYYGPISWATANNPTCCALTATVPSAIGTLTGSPAVGATNLNWNFTMLPASCNGNINYLVIEFDVKANNSPTIPPGQYFNTFKFSASNLGTPVTSNPAQVTINGYAQMQVFKDVRENISGTTFSSSANIPQGGQAQYRIRIQNTGTLTLSNIYLLDILPHIGDISVVPPYFYRGSQFDLPLGAALAPVTGYNYGYNTSSNTKNPTRSTLFCSTVNPSTGFGTLTPGVFSASYSPTFSFQIAGTASAMIAPTASQDFYFVANVPSTTGVGLTACNSFGVQAYPYGTSTCLKAESAPACVKVIAGGSPCDSLWGTPKIEPCCTFSTTVLNSTIGNLVQLDYNVLPVGGGSTPSGVVQSIGTAPCAPSSTSPAVIAGTTNGSLYFSPGCASNTGIQVHASSSTASGYICIELVATVVTKTGVKITCRDTVCFDCDPAPQNRCDSLSVAAGLNLKYSTRSFTIYNLKSPASPICTVAVNVSPMPSGLSGGGLVIDGVAQSWVTGPGNGWSLIGPADGLPANSTVKFDLRVPYGLNWVGTVTITTYHCDGQKCTMTYGPWDAKKGIKIDVGTPTRVPDLSTLHINSVKFAATTDESRNISSIALHYSDPATEIVALSGATYPCDPDDDQAHCNDIFKDVRVKDRSMMIDLRRTLGEQEQYGDPVLTVVYRSESDEPVKVEVIYYDANGQEIGYDEMEINGEDPPNGIVSGLDNNGQLAAMMGALTAHPNPTAGNCDLGFTLPAAAKVELEIIDGLGTKVMTVIDGEHLSAGEHHRVVKMGTIPSGSYMVSLRVNGVPSVLRMEVVK